MSNDLTKSDVGSSSETEEQAKREYDSSYARRYEGVAAGEPLDPDDPNKGGKYSDSDPTVAEEVDSEMNQDRNDDMDKGLTVLKSLNRQLRKGLGSNLPTELQKEFLVSEGYDPEEVRKGFIRMTPTRSRLFTDWLCGRLTKSVTEILGE